MHACMCVYTTCAPCDCFAILSASELVCRPGFSACTRARHDIILTQGCRLSALHGGSTHSCAHVPFCGAVSATSDRWPAARSFCHPRRAGGGVVPAACSCHKHHEAAR
eukprot:354266-Chlamydomonas_euryale.AAC.18